MTDTTNAANSSPITAGDAGNSLTIRDAAKAAVDAYDHAAGTEKWDEDRWGNFSQSNAVQGLRDALTVAPQQAGDGLTASRRTLEWVKEVLARHIDIDCPSCDCKECEQCGKMPKDCSGTECARTCQCSDCDHCQATGTLNELRAILAATRQPAIFEAEALIRACVPGGSICDPQQVADAIRVYAAPRQPGGGEAVETLMMLMRANPNAYVSDILPHAEDYLARAAPSAGNGGAMGGRDDEA